jgi:hypothetical protein
MAKVLVITGVQKQIKEYFAINYYFFLNTLMRLI